MTVVVRIAVAADLEAIFTLASRFATSFHPERVALNASAAILFSDESVWLAVAESDDGISGYCLGFDHFTFFANGRVSWVEEIMVNDNRRGNGIGRALMNAFEAWAKSRDSRLVALATRRAAPFYLALGYEKSADYFRKLLS